jgi:hypothetical protein
MSIASDFKLRLLTASEYVLDLFGPTEKVAVVVLNRATAGRFRGWPGPTR